ncbi:MAG TPA: chitinase, partial [Candidatus Binatia bacterium]|nr:chitinase [Candidatus Binatia bacterium]
SLSVSGLGSRVTGTFSPTSVTGSGSSTLTVTVNRRATRGARTLTISGVSGSLNHSTTATLNIQ